MRPVSLHVEGFGVFREPIDLSFEDLDYFALIGPTGAGKSTIIDAICFALYGSIPRYADERLVARAVSVGSQQAKVSLTFDIGPDRYVATRVVRTGKGKADAVLERVRPEGNEALASGARDMKQAVERLLGLPFAHFTKCVVLPQGDFAKFLHDPPAERRGLLTRLLELGVYERIGQRAREAAKEAARAVDLHERQLADLAFATPDARATCERRLRQLLDVFGAVDDARGADDRAAAAITAAEQRIAGAERRRTLLAAVTVPEGVDATGRELADARAAYDAAATSAAAAAAALAELEARADALGPRELLVRALEAHAALAGLAEQLGDAETAEAGAGAEVERAGQLVERARTHLAEAQTALDVARSANAAYSLARQLVAGEPCPVCEQEVVTVPKRRRAAALAKKEAVVAEAAAMLAAAIEAQQALAQEHAKLAERRAQIVKRESELAAAVTEQPDAITAAAALARIDDTAGQLAAARTADREARAGEQRATAAIAQAEQRASALRTGYAAQRDTLLRAGCEPPPPLEELAGGWHALSEWAAGESRRLAGVVSEARAEHASLATERAARVAELLARVEALGVPAGGSDLAAVRDLVIEHGTHAREELRSIDEAIERAAKVRAEKYEAERERDVAHALGELLRSDRFEKWVLAEALARLVEGASHTLFALSQGHFSLRSSDEEEFVVVDHHNADATRSVRTLSGGETFQASLALALALSDQLAELSAAGGAKLEALFCDEGFGSLDVDSLDAVASAIEALGTTGRMVGLVTHVPALAERVPVCFRVHNGRVERVGA